MKGLSIAVIVEGDGEVEAVPVLVRRYANLEGMPGRVFIKSLIRQSASKLMRSGELERCVELAARKLGGPGGILILLDSDDACPARLGPELLSRARNARSDVPIALVLAHREYEAWFLAAAASLAGRRDLPADLRAHPAPETVRACKEWISKQMPRGRAYREISDQPAFTEVFDLEAAASACSSFKKCDRELRRLLREVAALTCPDTPPSA